MDQQFSKPKSMKQMILRSLRKTLLQLGSATKVELSEHLDISFPTISKFISEMEKNGEVHTVGLDESSGGRRAQRYAYNPEHKLLLSIFLEKDETVYTIYNCGGERKDQGSLKSVLREGLPPLTKMIEDVLSKFPNIGAIAFGVPGSVENGRIFHIPDYDTFQNLDLQTHYEKLFSIPVIVENDMNAAVIGYYNISKTDNPSLVYLYFGKNGPGAGIFINGDVVRGSTFFTGEISFLPLYNDMNFLQALQKTNDWNTHDATARLIASLASIINPSAIIFSKDEVHEEILAEIKSESATYIPEQHLPDFVLSDWKQDYLNGLNHLALDRMISV
ncbi:ROK family transcriptional regulator [Bacillus gobiensis]|uniref:ROK family transcriptional regulator n=1 Tax=Bacillus gobiensis TaxID=1441095 RepID=UPI003D1E7BB8